MRYSLTIMNFVFIVAAILAAQNPLTLAVGAEPLDEPWSVSSNDPVIHMETEHVPGLISYPGELGCSLFSDFSYAWLRFYQDYLSPSLTAKCPMIPSCSQYSMQAIHKHGVTVGIMMTADRLIHEADEKRSAPLVDIKGDRKYLDPMENNDFWWNKP